MSQIKVEIQGSTAVITPIVALWNDLDTIEFQESIDKVLVNPNVTRIILDLHTVSHLNSTALGILVHAHGAVRDTPRSFILCLLQRTVENILTVTKVSTILDIRKTMSDALIDSTPPTVKASCITEQHGSTLIVKVVGHMMGGPDGNKLVEDCKQHLENPEVQLLVLDLREVTLISNGGLGSLVAIYVAAKVRDKNCALYKVSRRVGEILAITKLNTLFAEIQTI